MDVQEQSASVLHQESLPQSSPMPGMDLAADRYVRQLLIGGPTAARRHDARSEPRFQVRNDRASLSVLNVQAQPAREAQLLDISHSGLGIVVREEIPSGSWIRVEFGDVAVFGEVRYCRRQATGDYRLGALTDWVIAKADVARWGGFQGEESEAHLCASFRQMKSTSTRYGPPI